MALKISITTDFGVPAEYWNVGAYQEDFKGKGAQVTLYGYLNEEARTAGKQPLAAANIQLTGEKYSADMVREDIYAVLKTLPEYANAVDC